MPDCGVVMPELRVAERTGCLQKKAMKEIGWLLTWSQPEIPEPILVEAKGQECRLPLNRARGQTGDDLALEEQHQEEERDCHYNCSRHPFRIR